VRFKAHDVPGREWVGITIKQDDAHAKVKRGTVSYIHGKVLCGEEFELHPSCRAKPPSWADPVDQEAKDYVAKYERDVAANKARAAEEAKLTEAAVAGVASIIKEGRRRTGPAVGATR
jgi:hypothetical protein